MAAQPAPFVGSANPRRGRDCAGEIPKLVPCMFLKLAYDMRETQVALDLRDPNMDSVLDIHDLGLVITHPITKISGKAKSGQPKPPRLSARKPEALPEKIDTCRAGQLGGRPSRPARPSGWVRPLNPWEPYRDLAKELGDELFR